MENLPFFNLHNQFTGLIPSPNIYCTAPVVLPENLFNLNHQIPSTLTPAPENFFPGTIHFQLNNQFTSRIPYVFPPANFSDAIPFYFNNQFNGQTPFTFPPPPESNFYPNNQLTTLTSAPENNFHATIPFVSPDNFNLNYQFTYQISPIFAPSAENNFSGLVPLVSPENFTNNNHFPAQIPSISTPSPENNFYGTIPTALPENFNPNNQFITLIPAVENGKIFLGSQENFNLNNQFAAQIPSSFTHSAENNFPRFAPLAPSSENFNLNNQFTGQIPSPSPHSIGNVLNDTIPQISVNVVGNPATESPCSLMHWTESSGPVLASMGPPEIAVNVGNTILGNSETQLDGRSVLAQKRPWGISFQMANQIPGNGSTEVEAENEYEYTGLLSDVINFDSAPHKKKKVEHWTEDEHKLFLIGLKKFKKGNWRRIAEEVVVTRKPDQVASHAQKYFKRQFVPKQDGKRSSIHDITTVDADTEKRLLSHRRQLLQSPPAPPFSVNPTPPPPPPPVHSQPLPPDGQYYSEPAPSLQLPPVHDSSPIPSPVHYQSPPSPSSTPPPSPWPTLAVYESLLSPIVGVPYGSPPPPPLY